MTTTYQLPASTHTGVVGLTVSDLDRSIRYYEQAIGLRVLQRHAQQALLGAGDLPLLDLVANPKARSVRQTSGLYHFAILLPSRLELARAVRRLVESGARLDGASDHLVSEALYLSDPDGNGIEIYRDRPRHEWPIRNGKLAMATEPLDMQGVLGELQRDTGALGPMPQGTVMGHVHLHVGSISGAEKFYAEVLGFDVMVRYGPSASFLAAGGYHHHLGVNTWAGVGAPPAPADAVGLRYFTLLLPDAAALETVRERLQAAGASLDAVEGGLLTRDPFGNGVLLAVE